MTNKEYVVCLAGMGFFRSTVGGKGAGRWVAEYPDCEVFTLAGARRVIRGLRPATLELATLCRDYGMETEVCVPARDSL